jgi:hypothetical protein
VEIADLVDELDRELRRVGDPTRAVGAKAYRRQVVAGYVLLRSEGGEMLFPRPISHLSPHFVTEFSSGDRQVGSRSGDVHLRGS